MIGPHATKLATTLALAAVQSDPTCITGRLQAKKFRRHSAYLGILKSRDQQLAMQLADADYCNKRCFDWFQCLGLVWKDALGLSTILYAGT